MTLSRLFLTTITVLILCVSATAQTQESLQARLITAITRDGDTLTGRFDRWSSDTLVLLDEDGTQLRVLRGDIARVDEDAVIRAESKSEADATSMLFQTAPASGLIITPTAWPMPEGHPVVGLYELVSLTAGIGLGKHVTLSGVSTFFNGLSEGDMYSFGMKVSPFTSAKQALAIGVSIIDSYETYSDPLNLYYVVYSTALGSMNASAGTAILSDETGGGHMIFLGAEIPMNRTIRILLECIVPINSFKYLFEIGAALRFQHRRLRIELGGFTGRTSPNTFGNFAIPWIGVSLIL